MLLKRADYRSQSWFSIFIASCHAYCEGSRWICCMKSHHHMMENWFYWITLSAFLYHRINSIPIVKQKKRIGEACLIFFLPSCWTTKIWFPTIISALFSAELCSLGRNSLTGKFGKALIFLDNLTLFFIRWDTQRRCWINAKILRRLDACSHPAESQTRMKHRTEMSRRRKRNIFNNLANIRSFSP